MALHQQNPNKKSDSDYYEGELKYLVKDNHCRLLDGRRTPGYIKSLDIDHAMFVFHITDFEDKGKEWELNAEKVKQFQFEKTSKQLSFETIESLKHHIAHFSKSLIISPSKKDKNHTESRIHEAQESIKSYLSNKEIINEKGYNTDASCHRKLQEALLTYFDSINLKDFEEKTAQMMVLNPNSGEWIKALSITLAKLGLKPYDGEIMRTTMPCEHAMREYLIHRLAFIRVIHPRGLTVYRGMSSEQPFYYKSRSFISWTDSIKVANAFADFDNPQFKSVYVLKKHAQNNKLIMTHYETKYFNEAYQEKEVVLLHEPMII